jgi:hypothetical protein
MLRGEVPLAVAANRKIDMENACGSSRSTSSGW